jgi:membrane protein involved in colicin uptake
VQKAPARPGEAGREELTVTVPIPVQNVPPQRRRPLVIPGILGGLVVAGAVAAYFATRSPEQAPAPVAVTPQPPVAKVDPQPVQPQAEEAKKQEAQRLAEEEKKREAARLGAEEAKKKETARLAEEEKKRDAAKLAAEKKEAARLAAEEAKKKEAAAKLAAEETRKKEAAAKLAAEDAKKKEAARLAAEEEKKKEAARLAAEEEKKRQAAAKAAEEQKRQVAAAAKAPEEPKRVNGAELYARASELESQGKVAEAVKLYVAAANADHGPSAKRLGDIYSGGKGDVAQDYTASLRWHQRARQLGEKIQVKGR